MAQFAAMTNRFASFENEFSAPADCMTAFSKMIMRNRAERRIREADLVSHSTSSPVTGNAARNSRITPARIGERTRKSVRISFSKA